MTVRRGYVSDTVQVCVGLQGLLAAHGYVQMPFVHKDVGGQEESASHSGFRFSIRLKIWKSLVKAHRKIILSKLPSMHLT
jgi:hypothetical protein